MTPADIANALTDLGYDVRDLDGAAEAWCVWVAHHTDDIYDTQVWQNEDGTFTSDGHLSLLWHGAWDDVLGALAADKVAVAQSTAPRPPALPQPWELDPVAVGFVCLALGFLAGYVVGAM